MFIIAKTTTGKEYFYSTIDCYAISKAKKDIICNALNKAKYKLKNGEAWKVYDIGLIDAEYTNARFEKMYTYKGKIYIGSCH